MESLIGLLLIFDLPRQWNVQFCEEYLETWLTAKTAGKSPSTKLVVGIAGLLLALGLINWGSSVKPYVFDAYTPYGALVLFQYLILGVITLALLIIIYVKFTEGESRKENDSVD